MQENEQNNGANPNAAAEGDATVDTASQFQPVQSEAQPVAQPAPQPVQPQYQQPVQPQYQPQPQYQQLVYQQQPYQQSYQSQPNYTNNGTFNENQLPEQYKPLSPWAYFGYSVLFAIPLVGLICLFIFAFSNQNINRRNYARSFFCAIILGLIIGIFVLIVGGSCLAGIIGGLGGDSGCIMPILF